MRTKIMVYAALLSLGFVITAWASPSPLPVSPAQENEMPPMSETRQKPLTPPVPSRGQMLYENHCMSCHESVVHIRGNQRTQSLTELRGRVSHWVRFGEAGAVAEWRMRSASHANWPSLSLAVLDNIVPDFPLINKSFNLCYACVDR